MSAELGLRVPRKPLPRLVLAPLEPAELLFERLQEPSEESPILYRERAYLVDTLNSDDDLEEHLEAELSRIRRDWRHRDASQFVVLSLFDHRFQGGEPAYPPIATLSWKDWQGRSEIWVRGVRRSTMPPGVSLDSLPPSRPPRPPRPVSAEAIEAATLLEDTEVIEAEEVIEEAELIEVTDIPWGSSRDTDPMALAGRTSAPPESSRLSLPPLGDELDGSRPTFGTTDGSDTRAASDGADDRASDDRAPDSGPGWQSPEKSGEYLIPVSDEAIEQPPSSERVLAGEELLGTLFERMHELASVMTIGAGAEYVLGTLAEFIRCDGALLHVLDLKKGEYVVLRAVGPHSSDVLERRTERAGSHLDEPLREKRSIELGPSEVDMHPGVWPALGLSPGFVVASPIYRRGEPLGAIELCRSADKGSFTRAQVSAIEYVCEQFSDFVGDRPIDLTRASLFPPPA